MSNIRVMGSVAFGEVGLVDEKRISPLVKLCENSLGALRRSSGRTAKCFDLYVVHPFVVSPVEP
jgi:hypothetical protein